MPGRAVGPDDIIVGDRLQAEGERMRMSAAIKPMNNWSKLGQFPSSIKPGKPSRPPVWCLTMLRSGPPVEALGFNHYEKSRCRSAADAAAFNYRHKSRLQRVILGWRRFDRIGDNSALWGRSAHNVMLSAPYRGSPPRRRRQLLGCDFTEMVAHQRLLSTASGV